MYNFLFNCAHEWPYEYFCARSSKIALPLADRSKRFYNLLLQGEHIGKTEATEAFFAMTKLFQSKDVSI